MTTGMRHFTGHWNKCLCLGVCVLLLFYLKGPNFSHDQQNEETAILTAFTGPFSFSPGNQTWEIF